MLKKLLAFSGVLALIILLDPTPTPAQPPGGFGGMKGGMKTPEQRWDEYQQLTGGNGSTLDLGKLPEDVRARNRRAESFGGIPLPERGVMTRNEFLDHMARSTAKIQEKMAAGGGFNFGGKKDGGDGRFGGPPAPGAIGPAPMGGPPGGDRGAGGPRRGADPEMIWRMLQGATGSTGDTLDLSKIPPETRAMGRDFAERTGSLVLPESGVMTKAEYLDFAARSEAARADFAARNQDPNRRDRRDEPNRDGDQGYRPYEKKDAEEERPVAMRYGKLPKNLPGWYDELDTDKDGQVALYEWRKGGKEMKEFMEMDLNGDGLVTADEYLRFARQKNIDTKVAAYVESDGAVRPDKWGVGATDAKDNKGGERPRFGPGGPGSKPGDSGRPSSDTKPSSDSKPSDGKDREKGKNPWNKPKN